MSDQTEAYQPRTFDYWRNRWWHTLGSVVTLLALDDDADVEDSDTLARLLAAPAPGGVVDDPSLFQQLGLQMVCFAAQQFAFLLDGFFRYKFFRFSMDFSGLQEEPSQKRIQKLTNAIGPVDRIEAEDLKTFVLDQVLQQVGEDTMLLRVLASQYQAGETTLLGKGLRMGNGLAQRAIQSLGQYLPSTSVPLTYIRPRTGMRLVPYNTIPLVGFPVTSLRQRRDYLALPHELGHFLYWRGYLQAGGLPFYERLFQDANVGNYPQWLRRWHQEIFADVVGCMVGGPVVSLSLQDMLLDEVGKSFVLDAGPHPIPAVRPFATFNVLANIGWPNMSQNLHDCWMERLPDHLPSNPETVKFQIFDEDGESGKITIIEESFAQLRDRLISVGEDIYQCFHDSGWKAIDLHDDRTSGQNRSKADWERLYLDFEQGIDVPEGTVLPNCVATATWLDLVKPLLSDHHILPDAVTNGSAWALQVLADSGSASSATVELQPQEWVAAVFLLPWRNAGPSGGGAHVLG